MGFYGALMAGYLLLRMVSTRIYLWPVEAIGAYLHFLLLPALPLLILALSLRSRHTTLLLGIGSAAYLLLFGGLFLPRPGAPAAGPELTVMTHNTGNGLASWEELAHAIRRSGADVVAIQESVTEEIPLYAHDLSDLYPYQAFYGSGIPGIGMLSRFPIRQEGPKYFASPRPYLVAEIEVEGRLLTVVSAHPPVLFGPGAGKRRGYADYAMMADFATARGNTILAGDLNLSDQNEGYATMMRRDLTDAHRAAGFGLGLTYPTYFNTKETRPWIRIDYILTTQELKPLEAWVGEEGGSDHLPVLARIGWNPEG
jgi:endonuclease/exonuclease/phosphatase family metal-dependent hydrolase